MSSDSEQEPPPLPEDVRALLDVERDIPALPEDQLDRIASRIRSDIAPAASDTPAGAAPGGASAMSHLAASLVGLALGVTGTLLYQAAIPPEPTAPEPHVVRELPSPPAPEPRGRDAGTAEPVDGGVERRESAPSEEVTSPTAIRRGSRARPADRLSEERRMMDAARGALAADDPERALDVTRRHADRFPSGAMAEEREALAVRALLALDRLDAAQSRAAAFRRRYPESLAWPGLRARIDRAASARDERAPPSPP